MPPALARIDLSDYLRLAVEGTRDCAPDDSLPSWAPAGRTTRYEVNNESTLAAARRLAGEGLRVVALNFASARHPGGGFLNGARAQEESLCRSSGLYACIVGNPMYAFHAPTPGGFYSNYAIYSPAVPVFRTDDGDWLDEPSLCGFITAPAVNAGAIRDAERHRVRGEMAARVEKVLAVTAGHGHDAVVLGAWGCGVFRNDPDLIAGLFATAL